MTSPPTNLEEKIATSACSEMFSSPPKMVLFLTAGPWDAGNPLLLVPEVKLDLLPGPEPPNCGILVGP